MRTVIFAALLFLCGIVKSQIITPISPSVYGSNNLRLKATLALHIPEKDTTLTNSTDTTAQIFLNKKDGALWFYYKPNGFMKFADTTSIIKKQSVTTTISGLRSLSVIQSDVLYQTTDFGGGIWYYDPSDNTSSDNSATVIVNGTKRIKRNYSGPVYAKWFGAVGNGTTDDTGPLQAAINYIIPIGQHLMLDKLHYRITSPLQFGDSTVSPASSGGHWIVEGTQRQMQAGNLGTTIILDATGKDAVIKINKGAYFNGTFKNLSLTTNTTPVSDTYAAENGFKFSSTSFTAYDFENITISKVRNAIGMYQSGSSANGEFSLFKRVSSSETQRFLYMNPTAGQAFGHLFIECGFGANLSQGSPEYVAFELGGSLGGFGIHTIDFNSTVSNNNGTAASSYPPVVFLRNKGISGTALFDAGRDEGFTTIYDNQSPFETPISLKGIDFAALNSKLTTPVITSSANVKGNITIQDCTIPVFNSYGLGGFYVTPNALDGARYSFENCNVGIYSQSTAMPLVVTLGTNINASVSFKNCTYNRFNGAIEKLERTFSNFREGTNIKNDKNQIIEGVPQNLLQNPTFNSGTPASPWVATNGAFPIYQASGGNVTVFSSSPSARFLWINPNQSFYQDVSSITAANQYLYYTASLLASVATNSTDKLQISISNPTTGEIYDQINLGSYIGSAPYQMTTVKLSARSSGSTGNFRLTWNAPSTNSAAINVYLDWQGCSVNPQASYILPANNTTASYSQAWATADRFRVNGRFALPYKDDSYGSSGTLADLVSDMYFSSNSNRFKWYANGNWWDGARTQYASAAPTSGTYSLGDIVYSNSPTTNVGWICTTAGTPGTWQTFAQIGYANPITGSNNFLGRISSGTIINSLIQDNGTNIGVGMAPNSTQLLNIGGDLRVGLTDQVGAISFGDAGTGSMYNGIYRGFSNGQKGGGNSFGIAAYDTLFFAVGHSVFGTGKLVPMYITNSDVVRFTGMNRANFDAVTPSVGNWQYDLSNNAFQYTDNVGTKTVLSRELALASYKPLGDSSHIIASAFVRQDRMKNFVDSLNFRLKGDTVTNATSTATIGQLQKRIDSLSSTLIKTGIAFFSGNGATTTFDISLPSTPTWANAEATSTDASGITYRTPITGGIRIFYTVAPPSGSNNISITYMYK